MVATADYCIGFEELKEHVQQHTPEWAAEITWLSASDIKSVSRIYAQSKPACIVQGINTLDQHGNGFQLSRLLNILQTVTGNIDKPGTWVTIPYLRMTDLRLPMDEEPIGADQYPLFYSFWGRKSPYGIATLFPQAALESKPYPVRGAIVTAANPVVSFPEANKFIEAFKSMDFMMTIDLFMTDTGELGNLFLPAPLWRSILCPTFMA
ncbi:molybdopterin-dependent oxidoreductase [Sporotomaculum syntrophicum]|uniref:molybdopterin-dependent oxidoreductase n=1 Tax=Sporotomaculum syntrophicum TaxID=182264 RepID=UPI00137AB7E1|nr:molybdopterin-dependent oxidoreductase [Sporotomaculum syntrophicum]